jgi:hypothetical protein
VTENGAGRARRSLRERGTWVRASVRYEDRLFVFREFWVFFVKNALGQEGVDRLSARGGERRGRITGVTHDYKVARGRSLRWDGAAIGGVE